MSLHLPVLTLTPKTLTVLKNCIAQHYTNLMDFKYTLKTLILAIVGGAFTLTAFAQWQWLDKDGRKVFSDRSPPTEIQEKKYFETPRRQC